MKRINALWAFFKNLYAFITGQTLTLKEYFELELKEINGNDNKYYTIQNKHIDNPTDKDCFENYDETGAVEGFRLRNNWRRQKPWQKKVKKIIKQFIFSYKHTCILPSNHKGSPIK